MKIALLITLITMATLMGCNLEVNTVDPQASSTIEESKRDGFFLKEYKADQLRQGFFEIKEAWVEYVWKNQLVNDKIVKTKTGGLQLNLKLEMFMNNEFKEKRYLLDWEMKNTNGFFGKSNGVYMLYLKDQELPDSFNITIGRIKNNVSAENVDQFIVHVK